MNESAKPAQSTATPGDKVIIRICALCTLSAPKQAYIDLIQRLPEDEMAALLDMYQVTATPVKDLCEAVFVTDWKPLLAERAHLLQNDELFKELGLA